MAVKEQCGGKLELFDETNRKIRILWLALNSVHAKWNGSMACKDVLLAINVNSKVFFLSPSGRAEQFLRFFDKTTKKKRITKGQDKVYTK